MIGLNIYTPLFGWWELHCTIFHGHALYSPLRYKFPFVHQELEFASSPPPSEWGTWKRRASRAQQRCVCHFGAGEELEKQLVVCLSSSAPTLPLRTISCSPLLGASRIFLSLPCIGMKERPFLTCFTCSIREGLISFCKAYLFDFVFNIQEWASGMLTSLQSYAVGETCCW